MAIEPDPEPGIPEWVVTFGDMMSLLLTFFIMLVSMSEIKQEEQFQAMVESIRQQFGYDTAMLSLAPGSARPRSSSLPEVASMGRARRMDTMSGGDKVRAPTGDFTRVQTIRPGVDITLGGVVFFKETSAELSESSKVDLQIIAQQLVGKPQIIELRGHTSRAPITPSATGFRDNYDLAYQRAYAVKEFLVHEQSIDESRIRITVASDKEPVYTGTDLEELQLNSRVEIGLLDERVEDLEGIPDEVNR